MASNNADGSVIDAIGKTMSWIEYKANPEQALESYHKLIKASRGVAIAVANESNELQLKNPTTYFDSGMSDAVLPYNVGKESVLFYSACKKAQGVCGAVGCICYDIDNLSGNHAPGIKLAIMFSVPFEDLVFSNWWNVKIYTSNKVQSEVGFNIASKEMFNDLYNGTPKKGNNNRCDFPLLDGFRAKGIMTEGRIAKLYISIYKNTA